MFIDARIEGNVQMHKKDADLTNHRKRFYFAEALDAWRKNVPIQRSLGLKEFARPAIPNLIQFDEELCRQRYTEFIRDNMPLIMDFVKDVPLPVPADAFELGEKPKPQPTNVVARYDRTHNGLKYYLVAEGDLTPVGAVIHHELIGRLRKVAFDNPFGNPQLRWEEVRD